MISSWYPICVQSKQHLFNLDITHSFVKFPEVYFQVHQMENDSVQVFWRTSLSRDGFYEVASKAQKGRNVTLSLAELVQTAEYYEEMEKSNPLQSAVMSNDEAQILLNLFHKGLPKDKTHSGGRGGHSFYLTAFCEPPQRLLFWCIVGPELIDAVNAVNLLIHKANLNSGFFDARIQNP